MVNDIFTSDSYEIDDDTTLELVDNIGSNNIDIDFTPEDDNINSSPKFTAFTLDYMRKVVDFCRLNIADVMQVCRFTTRTSDDGH